jgi:saccharopine dehydrogenase-like NADP-dependent oxidoreductase
MEEKNMRLLLIGVGGVGTSAAQIIKAAGEKGKWMEKMVLTDYNVARAQEVAKDLNDPRFVADQVNARDAESIKALVKKYDITYIMNAVDPNFNQNIFDTALECGVGYIDCAMTLSKRHPEKPYELCAEKLGDYQFAKAEEWKKKGNMAIVGSGVEPGMADVFAKYAAKHLFDKIDEVNVRDGDNYTNPGSDNPFGFSIWTTIEECLNPPIIWEKGKGWFCTESFSEPEIFDFPGGVGPVEVINVEHEEVLLVPRYIDCNRVTFKFGVPKETRELLKNLETLGMDSMERKIKVGDTEIAPRDFLVKVAPNPLESSKTMIGKGCAGTWVTGTKDGMRRSTYLYQVSDNQDCMKKYGTSSVVAQTAMGPVIMLDLVANGIWKEAGVNGPEFFNPDPFIERMAMYGFPPGIQEKDSEYATFVENKAFMDALKK